MHEKLVIFFNNLRVAFMETTQKKKPTKKYQTKNKTEKKKKHKKKRKKKYLCHDVLRMIHCKFKCHFSLYW